MAYSRALEKRSGSQFCRERNVIHLLRFRCFLKLLFQLFQKPIYIYKRKKMMKVGAAVLAVIVVLEGHKKLYHYNLAI